jgi:hypothetical protein
MSLPRNSLRMELPFFISLAVIAYATEAGKRSDVYSLAQFRFPSDAIVGWVATVRCTAAQQGARPDAGYLRSTAARPGPS